MTGSINIPSPDQVVKKCFGCKHGLLHDLMCCIVAIAMFIIALLVGVPCILFLGPALLLAEVLVYERDRNEIERDYGSSELFVEGRVVNIITNNEIGLERAVLQYAYQERNYQTSRILTSLNRQYYEEIGIKVPMVLYSSEHPRSGQPQHEITMLNNSLPSTCKRYASMVGAFVTAAMLLLMDAAIFVSVFGPKYFCIILAALVAWTALLLALQLCCCPATVKETYLNACEPVEDCDTSAESENDAAEITDLA